VATLEAAIDFSNRELLPFHFRRTIGATRVDEQTMSHRVPNPQLSPLRHGSYGLKFPWVVSP
jgi:hypothetical protein